jgi:uncharacterized protein involved in exopolysaccharide biosynthesis
MFDGQRTEQDFASYTTSSIQSDSVLSNVVRELKLDSEQHIQPAKAIAALRKRLEIHQIPNTQLSNTRLFELTLTERTPAQAAKCANAIAIAYKAGVLNRHQALVQGGIRELKHQLESQQQKVSKLETELSQLRETLKLPSPEPAEVEVNYPEYRQAKNILNDEKRIVGLLARKISIEEIDLQSPSSFSQIEIVETAVPPTSPVRRKSLLGIILLVAGLGCCLWGLMATRDAKLTANLA